jgi:hypothetical protein
MPRDFTSGSSIRTAAYYSYRWYYRLRSRHRRAEKMGEHDYLGPEDPRFYIRGSEVKEIKQLLQKCGGSIEIRQQIFAILQRVVERTV